MSGMSTTPGDEEDREISVPIRGKSDFTFTIFIPTYNRAWCLPRALQSIAESTFRDFEVIVVDDGSTDGTRALIEDWQEKVGFPLRYIFQENAGKAAAHNRAVANARGFLLITLDSDDSMIPTALERIKRQWESIPEARRHEFAGVAGLCLNEDDSVSGDPYPEDAIETTYLEIFSRCRMNGERREAIRTEVLREFPYPEFPGERHVRPTLILRRMAHRYKLRFTNELLEINRHAPDGISADRFRYRMLNPRGLHQFYLEEITQHDAWSPQRTLARYHVEYVRFALHSGIGLKRQRAEVKHHALWLRALAPGAARWLGDRLKTGLRGLRSR
jgi:glycosyltransferase involved in cell wall biosynthesis